MEYGILILQILAANLCFSQWAFRRMADFKSRALDFLGKAFALKKSYAEAAEIWETRITFVKTPLERAYLFHEIGLCYVQMNKYDMAKYYANQALEEAAKIDDDIWAMNARIMLGQIEGKLIVNFVSSNVN
jgi:tetratricopeptide (TPR) repeat protein